MIPRLDAWPARAGLVILAAAATLAACAPVLAPNPPSRSFADRAYAPPTRVRFIDDGRLRAPFIYRQVLEDRVGRRFSEDRSDAVAIRWFGDGRLATVDSSGGPLLILGADDLGRDVFSRLLFGARLSLGVTAIGVVGALLMGAVVGGVAGGLGGRTETLMMLASDFVIVLPAAYLLLVLRGLLPRDLGVGPLFVLMACFFAVAGAPHVARGVRAIVTSERRREYAEAARAAGAGRWRMVAQLLPAARGFISMQGILLVPALLVAEVTVSYVGFGFPSDVGSWGTMLQSAGNVSVMRSAPWMLAPAAALFLVVLAIQMLVGDRGESSALRLLTLTPSRARR